MGLFSSAYSLRKSGRILRTAYQWYEKKWKTLSQENLKTMELYLEQLDGAVLSNNRSEADRWAKKTEEFTSVHCKKGTLGYFLELAAALIVAFAIAVVVRQMWFEPYEIPTGSMRPTFRELDRLLVTKTSFGLNTPLQTSHFYFDPHLVERTGVVIWTGDNIDLPDVHSTYFGILPYTKRFIKRLMAKPGDSIYFYGGYIYAVDKDGKELEELRTAPWMNGLEHIPFTQFEGRVAFSPSTNSSVQKQIEFRHLNVPTAKLSFLKDGSINKEIFNGQEWVKEGAPNTDPEKMDHYADFLGINNFAMARLLTKEQLKEKAGVKPESLEDGILYLQLSHDPNLSSPAPRFGRYSDGRTAVLLTPFESVIPLQKKHLNNLMSNLYTARFVMQRQQAHRYSASGNDYGNDQPFFAGVPDGTYEFYHGKGVKVGWGGMLSDLPLNHPLYDRSPQNIQKLFNLGIEFRTFFNPYTAEQNVYPSRYAYFRDGDLYVMGARVFKKDDPLLESFNKREAEKEKEATTTRPYVAFKDHGVPYKEGKIDADFIRKHGYTLPEKYYLVLGDNHAMSQDSRYFGPIPEANLEGSPSLIFWPMQERFGAPLQKPYHWITIPSLIVWGIVSLILAGWYLWTRARGQRPVFKKLS